MKKSLKMKIFMILLLISIFIRSSYSALRFDGLNIRKGESKSKSKFFSHLLIIRRNTY